MQESNKEYKFPILFLNALLCMFLVTLEVVSVDPLVIPPIYLVPIFFWLVYAPQLMPLTVIFLIGVFKDLLTGAPVGSTSLVLIILSVILVTQADTLKRQVKTTLWGCFAVFTLIYYFINYCVVSVIDLQLPSLRINYISTLVLVTMYPVVVACLLQILKIPVRHVRS